MTLVAPAKNGAESLANAGDVNGDGYPDIVAGAAFAFSGDAAFVYFGGAGGPAASPQTVAVTNGDQYAQAAAMCDVNGDGFADVVVSGGIYESQVSAYVFLGGENGVATTPTALTTSSGSGFAVANAGDVDGDGFEEILVGGTGVAYLYAGGAQGPVVAEALPSPSAADTYFGTAAIASFRPAPRSGRPKSD